MSEQVDHITNGLFRILPEIVLAVSFLLLLVLGLFKVRYSRLTIVTLISFAVSIATMLLNGFVKGATVFDGILYVEPFGGYLRLLMDGAAILTVILAFEKSKRHGSEFLAFLVVVVLGSHLLTMTSNFLMIFLSLEIISFGSYVLAGYSFTKIGTEGSLKYFLFGAVASAVMLYGFSLLYGLTGTLDFSVNPFGGTMPLNSDLVVIAVFFVLAGFLFKIAAFPMHIWAPDVYDAAPLPVLGFLSVVPKLAGFAVLIQLGGRLMILEINGIDWHIVFAAIAIATITVGNFSALYQRSVKRMLAYSSIAHTGFLLTAVTAAAFDTSFLFYASVFLLTNFSVVAVLQFFEKSGLKTIPDFQGAGRQWILPSLMLLIGLVSLTGLPPTAGFTAKLLVFSSLWQAYEQTDKTILLVLMVFGLVNTVISLFYYLRIPYFAYLKGGQPVEQQNIVTIENLLTLILVVIILILFFLPGLLMGWINKINFVV